MNYRMMSKKLRTFLGGSVLSVGLLAGGSLEGCDEVAQQFVTGYDLGQQFAEESDGLDGGFDFGFDDSDTSTGFDEFIGF